jgi:hypothetical protein
LFEIGYALLLRCFDVDELDFWNDFINTHPVLMPPSHAPLLSRPLNINNVLI